MGVKYVTATQRDGHKEDPARITPFTSDKPKHPPATIAERAATQRPSATRWPPSPPYPPFTPMIPKSPNRPATKIEQFRDFLKGPTPQSLLDPDHEQWQRNDDQPVYAARRADGSFLLYTRTGLPPLGKPRERQGDLGAFLDEIFAELRTKNRKGAAQLRGQIRGMLEHRDWRASPPTVRELRWLNVALEKELKAASDIPPEEAAFRQRARARVVIGTFEDVLGQWLKTVPEDDPRRGALQQAGQQLLDMLVQPDATLSFKGLTTDTIQCLRDDGLLTRFADLREGLAPPPIRLTAPGAARHLLDFLDKLRTIRTVVLF